MIRHPIKRLDQIGIVTQLVTHWVLAGYLWMPDIARELGRGPKTLFEPL
jgi:hypothetical protein